MNVRKEYASGALYLGFTYPVGQLTKACPRTREARRRITSEAKRRINQAQKKWRLMLLLGKYFEAGRDLFVCLTFGGDEPTRREAAKCLEEFHRKARAAWEKRGLTYRYIAVREEHAMDGTDVRLHYHLILSGCGRLMLGELRACWPFGGVDSRLLREFGEGFADTCRYLLKSPRDKGERAYNVSRNIKAPPEPIRRLVPESERMETPPGVKLIDEHRGQDGEAGSYAVLVGRIVDRAAFDRYMRGVKNRIDLRDPWRRIERRRRRRGKQSSAGEG